MSSSPSAGPSPTAAGLVAITVVLLAALVWAMRPAHLHLTPAPLQAPTVGCPRTGAAFVPTNITALPDQELQVLAAPAKNRVLLRANMEPCTCGCTMSIASCRVSQPKCATSRRLLVSMAAEVKSPH